MKNMSQRDRDWENIERYAKAPHDCPTERRLVELRDDRDSLTERIDRWTEATENDLHTLSQQVQTLQTQMTATQGRLREVTGNSATSAPHQATLEQWSYVRQRASECYATDSALCELADSLAAVEQRVRELQTYHNTTAGAILSLQAVAQGAPATTPSARYQAAMTALIAQQQPQTVKDSLADAPIPAPSPARPSLSDTDAIALWHRLQRNAPAPLEEMTRCIHRAGWDAAMAAVAAQQQPAPAPTPEPVPAEPSLVDVAMDALEAHHVAGAIEGSWDAQARAVIAAVADWLDQRGFGGVRTQVLRQEATR